MKKDRMITFIPFNVCAECGGQLVVIETETSIISLDKKGFPTDRENLFVDFHLRCADCKRASEAKVISMRYIEMNTSIPKVVTKLKNPFGRYD